MSQINVLDVPGGAIFPIAIYALAKKSQLKSESMAIRGVQIAREIPPFGLVIGMTEMIFREFVVVPRKSRLILRGDGLQSEKESGKLSNLHALPRGGSNARLLGRGRVPPESSQHTQR